MRLPKFRCKNKIGNWCFFTVLHGGNVNEENFDLETLSQFTGLSDKQGVEIYEGDIVVSNIMYNHPSQVIFYANSWCLNVPNSGKDGWCTEIKGATPIEVIGNIYENPELLEQQ